MRCGLYFDEWKVIEGLSDLIEFFGVGWRIDCRGKGRRRIMVRSS